MNTGENEMGLRKIIDLTRMISIVLLIIHFYYYCYGAFDAWKLTYEITDGILSNIRQTGLFSNFHKSKLFALLFLVISLIGARGRKTENFNFKIVTAYLVTGFLLYFISGLCFYLKGVQNTTIALSYFILTGVGYILILSGGNILTRIIKAKLKNDVFNKANETFPQEERLITNPYSINLPAIYNFKGKTKRSWINIINGRRGILILGSPGSGKSYFLIEHFIRQLSNKCFVQFVFDWKFPELTTLAYNYYLKNKHKYPVEPKFCGVNFTNPLHRLNPLYPSMMTDIVDAMDASKTMLLSINKTWINRQGEFFVESPINLLAAVIWFLKKYESGKYCTLPHAIELLQLPTDRLFTVLNSEPELQTLINTFINLYLEDNMETLSSQLASVNIPLGRLSSPMLYYILSGNDFTLDINNPNEPKIFCLGADPVRAEALAPVLSLIVDRLNKRFPKIMQDRESISINRNDTSFSKSKQLEASIPPSTISTLSSGEFVGIMADNPDQPIELKAIHCKVINDHEALRKEKLSFHPTPFSKKAKDQNEILFNYMQIKEDAQEIADVIMEQLLNDPAKEHLVIKK